MNSINSISPDIRDFLLSKNLSFSDTITNNNLIPLSNGIGFPVQFNTDIFVNPSNDLEIEGNFYKDLNIINNKFSPNTPEELTNIEFNNVTLGNIGEYPNNIGSSQPNSTFSEISKNSLNQLNNNKYLPNSVQSYQTIILNNNNIFNNQKVGGYLDNNGRIRNSSNINGIDTISGLLTGASDFDIRSSLASRLLSGAGVIDDTELGIIGNRELLKAMKAKALFNTRREFLGKVNLNPTSLILGDDFIKEDYSITVPSSKFGRVLDVGLTILGFESPISYMDTEASIFNYELYGNEGVLNDWYSINKARIKNTSKGQLSELFKNLKNNVDPRFNNGGKRYTPGYEDDRLKNSGLISDFYVNYNLKSKNVDNFDGDINYIGDYSRNIVSNVTFSWNTSANYQNLISDIKENDILDLNINKGDIDNVNTKKGGFGVLGSNTNFVNNDLRFNDKKTILGKTQELFDKGIIKTLLANKGMINNSNSLLETTENKSGTFPMTSKGSAVKYIDKSLGGISDNPNDVFCRSWVNYRSYNQVGRLQKHTGLNPNAGIRSQNYKKSVLDTNGFVKFAPYKGDFDNNSDVKKYMFSLENLSWSNDLANLPPWEIGNGDKITGTKGRIMWFPPYDLNFNESVNVGLDTTTFIGRGEPVYTYNNTERTGSLSFKVIMDHPNYLNDSSFQSRYNEYFDDLVNSIVSGCGDIPESISPYLTQNEKDEIELENATKIPIIPINNQNLDLKFKIYFPNDVSELDGEYSNYEVSGSTESPIITEWQKTKTGGYTPGITTQQNGYYEDRFNYGLNKVWRNPEFLSKLKSDLIEKCPSCRVKITGYASTDGKNPSNKLLSEDRAANVAKFFKENIINDENPDIQSKRFAKGEENGKGKGETGSSNVNEPVDHINKKLARYVEVTFEPDATINELNKEDLNKKIENLKTKILNNKIRSRFFNESDHFLKLKEEDPIVYNSLKDKIKFFHPSFHSITPEGFNSRLTFLHQCTRQGSTLNNEGRPDNMSFGMAPICILRLGDFYHTKIMLNSMSIDYENTWDLNPEGVGVQPMIATVNLDFKFIGGHSMEGPINRLQNAIAFNFFANTEIYDPRADKIILNGGEDKGTYVKGINNFNNLFEENDTKNGVTTNLPEGSINQEKAAENISIDSSSNSLENNGELKLKGFNKILLNDVSQLIENRRIVGVGVTLKIDNLNSNIGNIDDFLIKKVKLTFSTPDGLNIIGEEFITDPQKFIDSGNGIPYFIGKNYNGVYGFIKDEWVPGNYIITLTYNNIRISSSTIKIN